MINKSQFDNSIRVLVNAYLNDTLIKGNCAACAVGNLVADACNIKFIKVLTYGYNPHMRIKWEHREIAWNYVFISSHGDQVTDPYSYENNIHGEKDQIDSTGYTWQELARIEKAFECSNDMFEGLMNVVEILGDIHEIDFEEVKQVKELFVK